MTTPVSGSPSLPTVRLTPPPAPSTTAAPVAPQTSAGPTVRLGDMTAAGTQGMFDRTAHALDAAAPGGLQAFDEGPAAAAAPATVIAEYKKERAGVLASGSHDVAPNQDVHNLQTTLSQLRDANGQPYLSGEADGQFGPKTADAVRRFQAEHHLNLVDAKVGPETTGALQAAVTANNAALAPATPPTAAATPGTTPSTPATPTTPPASPQVAGGGAAPGAASTAPGAAPAPSTNTPPPGGAATPAPATPPAGGTPQPVAAPVATTSATPPPVTAPATGIEGSLAARETAVLARLRELSGREVAVTFSQPGNAAQRLSEVALLEKIADQVSAKHPQPGAKPPMAGVTDINFGGAGMLQAASRSEHHRVLNLDPAKDKDPGKNARIVSQAADYY